MLVTGNGIVLVFEDDNADDTWWDALLDSLDSIPTPLEDTVAEHALDTICFLQDEDISTPYDDFVQRPWMATLADLDLV